MPKKPAPDADVRRALLQAADELFYERGIHEVSMDQLRGRSGIDLKRIYSMFPSKSDLVASYLRARGGRLQAALEAHVLGASSDPKQQLVASFDALSSYVANESSYQGCAFHRAFGELSGSSPETVLIVREHKNTLQEFLTAIARGADLSNPDLLASQLFLLFEGSLMTVGITGNRDVVHHAKQAAQVLVASAAMSAPSSES